MLIKTLPSILVTSIILFFWGSLALILPWSAPTAQTLGTQGNSTIQAFQTPQLIELPSNSLTTPEFEQRMTGKVYNLMTDESFSWIITPQTQLLPPTTHLTQEYINWLLVAILLAVVLLLTRHLTQLLAGGMLVQWLIPSE